MVRRENPITFPELQDSISQYGRNIFSNALLSAMEHALLRIQIVADNNGNHVEHVFL